MWDISTCPNTIPNFPGDVAGPYFITGLPGSYTLGSERCSAARPCSMVQGGTTIPCSVQWALGWGLKQLWLQSCGGLGNVDKAGWEEGPQTEKGPIQSGDAP